MRANPAYWNNGCNSITPCVLSVNAGNLGGVCFILMIRGRRGVVLIYRTWHFRWHLFHLDVTPHDINSDSSGENRYHGIVRGERGGELTSWSLLHVLYCPGAPSKIMFLSSFLMCADEAATSVWCTVKNGWSLLLERLVLVQVTRLVIIPRYIPPVPAIAFRLSFCIVAAL